MKSKLAEQRQPAQRIDYPVLMERVNSIKDKSKVILLFTSSTHGVVVHDHQFHRIGDVYMPAENEITNNNKWQIFTGKLELSNF